EGRRPAVPGDQDDQPRGSSDGRIVPRIDLGGAARVPRPPGGRGMTADEVIELLKLQPHPVEGGFFRETYRTADLLAGKGERRSISTAIYYLLTPKTVSALHRLPGDEVFHFYAGDPVRMLQLWPDGTTRTLVLGTDLKAGQVPQLVVPGGVWQ